MKPTLERAIITKKTSRSGKRYWQVDGSAVIGTTQIDAASRRNDGPSELVAYLEKRKSITSSFNLYMVRKHYLININFNLHVFVNKTVGNVRR